MFLFPLATCLSFEWTDWFGAVLSFICCGWPDVVIVVVESIHLSVHPSVHPSISRSLSWLDSQSRLDSQSVSQCYGKISHQMSIFQMLSLSFHRYGSIKSLRLVKDTKSGKSKGYAFVEVCYKCSEGGTCHQ